MRPIAILAIVTLFFSCDDKGQHFDHTDVIGQYQLTEWNAPIPVDLDQDGHSSRNLVDESDCFDNAELIVYADGTFSKTYQSVFIEGNNLICHHENWTGIWERTGDILKLTWETENGMTNDTYNFGSVNQRLTRTMEDVSYPKIENGQLLFETGHVNVVFSKME